MEGSDFVVEGSDDFQASESEHAKSHWSHIGVRNFYMKDQPWSEFMSQRILSYSPSTVFEFGCNVGRNLSALSRRDPNVVVSGIDINAEAIAAGVERGLNLAVGDETTLAAHPDRAFDVVFTVSVIDHVPDPVPIVASLGRIARRAVLLLEPWLGKEGKVVQNRDRRTGELIDTTPFSYSWDYARVHAAALPAWSFRAEPYPMDSNLGRYYELYTMERSGGPEADS